MRKIYITYKNKTKFYYYNASGTNINLTEEEINKIINILNTRKIMNIKDYEDFLSVILEGNIEITIDSADVVKDAKLQPFINKVTAFDEQQKLNELKNSYPEGYTPRVNRRKSKNIGKRIVSASLAASILLGVPIMTRAFKENDKSKTDGIVNESFVDMPKESLKMSEVYYDKPIVEDYSYTEEVPEEFNGTTVDLAIAYKPDGKYESTVDYCGDLIKYYWTRYGLPYELGLEQITQERPNIDENGNCENICQINTDFIGTERFHVPVYDANGFTGEYDDFIVTAEMYNSLEGNIKIGAAYTRKCVDRYDSLFTGTFSYNQGLYALNLACEYYGLDVNTYKGDENTLAARDLIVNYYQELKDKGEIKYTHGDPNYLENVLGYGSLDRGTTFEYYLGEDLKTIEINNTLEYNMTSNRG